MFLDNNVTPDYHTRPGVNVTVLCYHNIGLDRPDSSDHSSGVTLAALLPNSLSHIFSGILTDLRALTILLSLLVYWNWFDVAIIANSLL